MRSFFRTIFTLIFLVGFGFVMFTSGYFTVKPGEVAIKIRLGKLSGAYEEGFYIKIPFIDEIGKYSIKIKRTDINTEAFSKDLQPVKVQIAINHRIEKTNVESVYRNLGIDYENSVLDPITQEETKAVLSKYSAEEIISNRTDITKAISEVVKSRMLEKQIVVTDLSITDFDFSEIFLKAIEDKQIAAQMALKAKNDVERVKQEAEQTMERARAEAASLKMQRDALSPTLVQLRSVEAQVKAIEKWDGKLPQYSGGNALPFINIKQGE